MEGISLQPYMVISWAGVVALLIVFVLRPLTRWFVAKYGNGQYEIEERMSKLETNDLRHLTDRVEGLEQESREFRKEMRESVNNLTIRVSVLETRFNGMK